MATQIELSYNELQHLCRSYLHQTDQVQQSKNNSNDNNNNNFEVLRYELKPASNQVAGFLGRHQLLTIEMRLTQDDNKTQTKHLTFFTKSPPHELASRMEYLEEFGVFKKEVCVYRDILPRFMRIYPNIAPHCYYADENLLVFENLSEQGYRMGAGRDGLLNYEQLRCALKTLASMHASSIIYETRCGGRKVNELHPAAVVENAYPSNVPPDHMRNQNVTNAGKVFAEFLKLIPKYQECLPQVLPLLSRQMFTLFELVKPCSEHQNVFSHGDLWANNIMFQYDKLNEKPIQCRFVDFQLGRYTSPLVDVLTLLTIPTSRSFRAQYLDALLNEYYCYISEFLKLEQLRVEDYLTRAKFEAAVGKYRIAGLIESMLFSHLTILPPESTAQLTSSTDGFTDFFARKRVEICMEVFNTDKVYRERMIDMLEDFVDRYVLPLVNV